MLTQVCQCGPGQWPPAWMLEPGRHGRRSPAVEDASATRACPGRTAGAGATPRVARGQRPTGQSRAGRPPLKCGHRGPPSHRITGTVRRGGWRAGQAGLRIQCTPRLCHVSRNALRSGRGLGLPTTFRSRPSRPAVLDCHSSEGARCGGQGEERMAKPPSTRTFQVYHELCRPRALPAVGAARRL